MRQSAQAKWIYPRVSISSNSEFSRIRHPAGCPFDDQKIGESCPWRRCSGSRFKMIVFASIPFLAHSNCKWRGTHMLTLSANELAFNKQFSRERSSNSYFDCLPFCGRSAPCASCGQRTALCGLLQYKFLRTSPGFATALLKSLFKVFWVERPRRPGE